MLIGVMNQNFFVALFVFDISSRDQNHFNRSAERKTTFMDALSIEKHKMQGIVSESIVGYKLVADGVNTVNTFVRIIGNTYNTRKNTIRSNHPFRDRYHKRNDISESFSHIKE